MVFELLSSFIIALSFPCLHLPFLIPMVLFVILHFEGDVWRQRVGVWSQRLWQELLIQSPGRGEIHCPKPGAVLLLDATRKTVPFLILPM